MSEHNVPLPPEYKPFDRLLLCSNALENVLVPVVVKGAPVFLLGQGATPLLWLWAFEPSDRSQARPVVVANQVAVMGLSVEATPSRVVARATTAVIIDAFFDAPGYVKVVSLDLRPVGVDIAGNERGLMVGRQHLVSNSFKGFRTMIAIGN